MLTDAQFRTSFILLRGLASLGVVISPDKQAQKIRIGRILLADLISPMCAFAPLERARTIAEIRMHCPELFL